MEMGISYLGIFLEGIGLWNGRVVFREGVVRPWAQLHR